MAAEDSQYRELRTSGSQLNSHAIFEQIQWSLENLSEECCLEFDDVDANVAREVACALGGGDLETRNHRFTYNASTKELRVVLMSTAIHNIHQWWMAAEIQKHMYLGGYLNSNEIEEPIGSSGTTFDSFGGPYTGSHKRPDFCLYLNTFQVPTVVIESGWSESRPALERDAELWLKGRRGTVQLVMINKWTKDSNQRVSGDIRAYDLDPAGNIRNLQTEDIFPHPANDADQGINITRSQLYGPASLPPGRNRTDVWRFSLDHLRNYARSALQLQGYAPT